MGAHELRPIGGKSLRMTPLRANVLALLGLIGLTVSAKALAAQQAPDPRVADLVRAGQLRAALFAAQYTRDAATGEIRGDVHLVEVARALAARLGIRLVLVGYPTPPDAVQGLKEGSSDVAFLGADPAWAAALDYSPPVFELDYTFLVPQGSSISSVAAADQPGIRIAVARNHASTLTLSSQLKHATMVYADAPDLTFELLRSGQADSMASTANALYSYSARLPGSRVLADRYGFTQMGLAVVKGKAAWLAYFNEVIEDAKDSGLIQRAIDRGTIRGMHTAPSARSHVPN